jgi:hypothetical protein
VSGWSRRVGHEEHRTWVGPRLRQAEGAFGVLLAGSILPLSLGRTYPKDDADPRGEQFVKIPPGRYVCRRTYFHRGGFDTYEVTGVEGHSRLLFHKGNVEADSEGCILVGQRFDQWGRPAVLESALAFSVFMRLTADASLTSQ